MSRETEAELRLSEMAGGVDVAAALGEALSMAAGQAEAIARQAGELEMLGAALTQSYQEVALLRGIGERMRVTRAPGELFRGMCEDMQSVLEAGSVVALWQEGQSSGLERQWACGAGEAVLDERGRRRLWEAVVSGARRGDAAVLYRRGDDAEEDAGWPIEVESLLAVGIQREAELLGVLAAVNRRGGLEFDALARRLLGSVANQTAVYLENFRLYSDLHELLLGALRALTNSIDAKDPYTCGHSERVALISRWLAEQVGMGVAETDSIYLSGLLHDVGKIGVSEAVLRKPGALLGTEYEQITRHPAIGATILGGIRQMAAVTPAVLSHHEHWDGSGYPRGLAGSRIPLGGRIVMLADSFDAMTSDRTYRRALGQAMALAEIRRFSGTQFDPELAEVFLGGDVGGLGVMLAAQRN